MAAMPRHDLIDYPESDGEPMAETDLHRDEMFELIDRLRRHFRDRDDAYVSGNMLVYYVEGDPKQCFAPDTFVAFGVPTGRRRIWKVWEEGKVPDVVFEVSSRKTSLEDEGNKKVLCARLGIAEYWLYDPEADFLDPPLQGFSLVDGSYVQMPLDIGRGLVSEALGLRLMLEDGLIELYRLDDGQPVPRIDALRAQHETGLAARDAEIDRLRAILRAAGIDDSDLPT